MRVTELDTSMYPGIITGTPTESHGQRSTGTLHLSQVYRDMEETALVQRKREASEEELAWYAAGGYLWERVFAMAHTQAMQDADPDLIRTDEWECDGVVGSPDCVRLSTWTVVELKFRWMSSNKFDRLEKYFWLELVQVKGYCKMVGTREAELIVFFCNGDYRPPRPKVRGVGLEFSDQEIEESWQTIVNHARRRRWL
jgi:hypothetical protein